MRTPPLLILSFVALVAVTARAQDQQGSEQSPTTLPAAPLSAGRYTDEVHIRVVIDQPAAGSTSLAGSIARSDGKNFPFKGTRGADGASMTGQFNDDFGNTFGFNAVMQGDSLIFRTGETAYVLYNEARTPQRMGQPVRLRFGALIDENDNGAGAVIFGVLSDSPAARAGLLPRDRIVELDGKDVRDLTPSRILDLCRSGEGGSQIILGVLRGDSNDILHLTVTRTDAPFTIEQSEQMQRMMRARSRLPMALDDNGNAPSQGKDGK
jgi:membrane-associated protease RseP (regulator of RpoE activity)